MARYQCTGSADQNAISCLHWIRDLRQSFLCRVHVEAPQRMPSNAYILVLAGGTHLRNSTVRCQIICRVMSYGLQSPVHTFPNRHFHRSAPNPCSVIYVIWHSKELGRFAGKRQKPRRIVETLHMRGLQLGSSAPKVSFRSWNAPKRGGLLVRWLLVCARQSLCQKNRSDYGAQ